MKVWLLSLMDYDGVEPLSLHKNLDIAKAKAERLLVEYQEKVVAEGKSIVKGYEARFRTWRQTSTGWEYAGYQVEEMEIEE